MLNLHQKQMKEQWDSLSSITNIQSILGIIPKYRSITKMLECPYMNNVCLNYQLYQIDADTLFNLKSIILFIRSQHLDELSNMIEVTSTFVK